MIIALKLINGEEIMGFVENNEIPIHQLEYISLYDPMYILDQRDEYNQSTMRMEDALLLSEEEYLTFSQKHVITYYRPAPKLCDYYEKASVYAKNYAKPRLHQQITKATKQIERTMREEESGSPWENHMREAFNTNPTKH